MSTDKQNIDNELAMAILNGLSGPNACKGADERRRMIPLHVADQAVASCEKEITRLRGELFKLTCKGAAMAGYLEAMAGDGSTMIPGGELQSLVLRSVNAWNSAVEETRLKP
jgi:hypothetical protein